MSESLPTENNIKADSEMIQSISRDVPLESTGNDETVDLPEASSDVREDGVASMKRENPDDAYIPKSESESTPTPVPGVSNVSTGNTEYEVSDDDYTNDFSEMSSKRRRRETRLSSQQAATCPILRGQYSIEEKVCTWEGKWGMGMNGQINGISSDFKYTMSIPEDASPSGPQSGIYNGFFWMKTTPAKRIQENNLSIQFVQNGSIYRVTGSGENKFGVFSVEGTYNPETMDMVCSKIYRPSQAARRKGHDGEVGEREYHTRPREATPSFLRESIDVPAGLTEDMKMCYKSLKRLMNHKWAGPFLQPVDPVALNIPDYFDIIKQPMDLGTIQKNIENHVLITKEDFADAIKLVFDNAVLYNKPQDDVTIMANTLRKLFERDYSQITRRLFESEPEPSSPVYSNKIPKHSYISRPKQRTSKSKNSKVAKNKKAAMAHRGNNNPESFQNMMNTVLMLQNKIKVMEEKLKGMDGETAVLDNAIPMTVEEKKTLGREINNLENDELQHIINIIQNSNQVEQQGGEIVIDLDTLPNDTLRNLQFYVKQCKEKSGMGGHSRSYEMTGTSAVDNTDSFFNYNSDSENSVNQDFF